MTETATIKPPCWGGRCFSHSPDDRGWRRALESGLISFSNVRPRELIEKQTAGAKKKKKKREKNRILRFHPGATNKPPTSVSSLFRCGELVMRAAEGNPAVSFVCLVCVCRFSLLMKWQRVAAASYSLTHPASVPLP